MRLFPVNHIVSDFINFTHVYSLHSSSTHHQPAKHIGTHCSKAPMGVSHPSSPVTPENIAGFRRWEEFTAVLSTYPDEQAT